MLSSTFSTTHMQSGASFMGADAGAGAMPGTMAFIPRWLLECKELTIAEKLLLAAVMTLPYGLFQHVSDFVMDLGMSKSHGCRTMRQLRAKAWLYEDCSMRGRSVIRVNMAKAEKFKIEWQARVAIERETQSSLLANMTLKASQSPAESVAQNAANVSAHEQESTENIMQMAVGQTFISAIGNQWETCGKTVGNFGTVPPAAPDMASSVPPAALAVPSAAPAVPPAAPTYIQYINNRNSIYSNGRSPIARGRAQAAQQGQTEIKNYNENLDLEQGTAQGAVSAPVQAPAPATERPHIPSFTILEEIDLTFPPVRHEYQAQPQVQPQPQLQLQVPAQDLVQAQVQAPAQPAIQAPVQAPAQAQTPAQAQPHSSMSILDKLNDLTASFTPSPAPKARAKASSSSRRVSSEAIGFQDVLDAVTALDASHGYARDLNTSTAALAGEIMAHYTAGGRNWRVGQSRTTKQSLPALCQRYLDQALERSSSSYSARQGSGKGYTAKRASSCAYVQNSGHSEVFAGKIFTPAAGYVERQDNFNPPPPPGALTDGERLFGRNEDILAALAMGGAQ